MKGFWPLHVRLNEPRFRAESGPAFRNSTDACLRELHIGLQHIRSKITMAATNRQGFIPVF